MFNLSLTSPLVLNPTDLLKQGVPHVIQKIRNYISLKKQLLMFLCLLPLSFLESFDIVKHETNYIK